LYRKLPNNLDEVSHKQMSYKSGFESISKYQQRNFFFTIRIMNDIILKGRQCTWNIFRLSFLCTICVTRICSIFYCGSLTVNSAWNASCTAIDRMIKNSDSVSLTDVYERLTHAAIQYKQSPPYLYYQTDIP
jgi:hypothetical protein